jgi:hypothetical protein
MRSQTRFGQVLLYAVILNFSTVPIVCAVGHSERIVNPANIAASLQPPPPGMNGDKVFAGLLKHTGLRDRLLEQYSVLSTYKVGNMTGKTYAKEVVEVRYRAPNTKNFAKKSEQGSWLVRRLVLDRLISSEQQASTGRDHRDSSITPRNYSFKLLGEGRAGSYECYVVKVSPKRSDKYLFRGWMWISTKDFGIVRIVGSPAKRISFWVEHVDFERQYQKIGIFWLPAKDESAAEIRWKGTKLLTIVHTSYSVNGFPSKCASVLTLSGGSQMVAPQSEILTPGRSKASSPGDGAAYTVRSGEKR